MSEEIIDKEQIEETVQYNDDNITHLSDVDHIRTRPGMYIGRLGDGSHTEDGIYVLLKEAIDNSIDEFRMNAGKRIEANIFSNRNTKRSKRGRAALFKDRKSVV